VVTADELRASASGDAPPAGLSGPVQSLWWAAKGGWEAAHKIVMEDESAEAAWVHAYLHRAEGDLPNAGYWYRTAKKPVASGALNDEWAAIARQLLGAIGG
jgi:hypothetical protein